MNILRISIFGASTRYPVTNYC